MGFLSLSSAIQVTSLELFMHYVFPL